MLIEQEKFESVKELAEIHTQISIGSANLLKLKEETEDYLLLRESWAKDRIAEVLRESQDVLGKISLNHEELTSYGRELKAYANELNDFFLAVSALSQDFQNRMKQVTIALDEKRAEISRILQEIKNERSAIAEERKQLTRERAETAEGVRVLNDSRETLKRGFDELQKLQQKEV